ncbi:hypothetical protein [Microbacterium sp. NPDC076911]|uniref:hypothetical protein n=1 Tax=Microbacterium sp. NPDC076911 TaxID=3154958 RepID=UPI00343A4B65
MAAVSFIMGIVGVATAIVTWALALTPDAATSLIVATASLSGVSLWCLVAGLGFSFARSRIRKHQRIALSASAPVTANSSETP